MHAKKDKNYNQSVQGSALMMGSYEYQPTHKY